MFTCWFLAGISGTAEKLDSARTDYHGLANTVVLGFTELPERALQETQAEATRPLVIQCQKSQNVTSAAFYWSACHAVQPRFKGSGTRLHFSVGALARRCGCP